MHKNIIPILSTEITFHRLNKKDFFIHQTRYDHRIRITPELFDFIQIIDNKKTLDALVVEYNQRYDIEISTDFAHNFLFEQLAKYGIVESQDIKVNSSKNPGYLKLNFIVFNEKVVSKLTKHLAFLFDTRVAYSILSVAIVFFVFCFIEYNDQIFNTAITRTEWLFFFLLSFAGATFHELGHASATHYYGAKHGGIGGGFYLLMPVYFADVTDIWKLPKHQRVVVNLAGMYFEMVYAWFLVLLGFIFHLKLLIILSCVFSLYTIRNLNPFARSDGYWILSDLLEKPNLMTHGFIKIKQLFNAGKTWCMIDYVLLAYGLISYSFIIYFIYYMVFKNPDSILYFPNNIKDFVLHLFTRDATVSLQKIGHLFVPALFYYLVLNTIWRVLKRN